MTRITADMVAGLRAEDIDFAHIDTAALSNLQRLVDAEVHARLAGSLADTLSEVVAQVLSQVPTMDPIVRMRFGAEEYDNGFFFSEVPDRAYTGPEPGDQVSERTMEALRVRFRDTLVSATMADLMADLSAAYAVGAGTTLEVDLREGSIDVDTYRDL